MNRKTLKWRYNLVKEQQRVSKNYQAISKKRKKSDRITELLEQGYGARPV